MSPGRPQRGVSGVRGTALLAALCFVVVLAVALGSYITVCYRTLALSTRTMRSLHNLALAEIGLEDALWALNNNNWSGWMMAGTTATKTLAGFNFDGGVSGTVSLTVTNYDGSGGTRVVIARGTTQDAGGGSQHRTVTATAERAPLFVNAVAATTGRVRFRAAGSADSYHSTRGDYSAQTPGYSAVISSGSTSPSSATVQLGNAQIKGFVATVGTGPSYGLSGRLAGPASAPGIRVDPTRVSTSPYQPIFDEVVPTGSGALLPRCPATIGVPAAISPSIYYAANCLLAGADVLTVDGPVVLVLSGDLFIAGAARIRITARGSLRLHVHGDLGVGGEGIQNDTRLPRNLVIIATTNPYESYVMATNTAFYGIIYAPVSGLTVSNSQAIYGAIVAKSVTFLQSPAIHYDLALRSLVMAGVNTPFGLGRWRETYDGS
jgi:hypothetical protein